MCFGLRYKKSEKEYLLLASNREYFEYELAK